MEYKNYALLIGAILFVGVALVVLQSSQTSAAQQSNSNNTGTQFFLSLTNKTKPTGNATAAGNYTLGALGFGNKSKAVQPQPLMVPVNTTSLKLHIDEAKSSLNNNDTKGALTHVIAALEEVNKVLSGNATTMTPTNTTTRAASQQMMQK